MRTAPTRCSAGRMHTAGAPSERIRPATRRGYSLALKTPAARSRGLASAGGHRGPGLLHRALHAGAPGGGFGRGIGRRRGGERRAAVRRRAARRASPPPAPAPEVGSPAREPSRRRSRIPRPRRGAAIGASVGLAVALPDPAGVGGTGGAQLADRAGTPVGDEDLVLLAPQQPARAQLAGDVGLGCDDRAGCHVGAATLRVSRGVRLARLLHDLLGQVPGKLLVA